MLRRRWLWRDQGDVFRDAMSKPSHTGDDAAEVTWARCDVDAESC
jgi:hypothetical protein